MCIGNTKFAGTSGMSGGLIPSPRRREIRAYVRALKKRKDWQYISNKLSTDNSNIGGDENVVVSSSSKYGPPPLPLGRQIAVVKDDVDYGAVIVIVIVNRGRGAEGAAGFHQLPR